MHQLLIVLVLGVAFSKAEDEPFSIGLGVLSPSYQQTVGKENVKVTFDQKENGQFSYSVGDPKSGTNTYLNFGPSAGQASPSSYQNSNYGASSYGGPSGSSSYGGPSGSGSHYGSQAPAYSGPTGYFGNNAAREAEGNSAGFLPAGFSYHATEGQAFLRQGEQRDAPAGPAQMLPAGFSYHATDGQSFLQQGESPDFMIEDPKQGSARGPAEQSFYGNFQRGGPGLENGLVGYGPGGPARGGLPIGGYAGPQFQGVYKEHGGHSE